MEIRKKNNIIVILILLIASGITQCAPKTQIIKEDDGAILRRRVQEYWGYKIKGEWDKSYLYESPEFREKVNLVKYINQYGRSMIRREGFDILEVWTSGEEGYVKLKTQHRYMIPQVQKKAAFESAEEEMWVKKENQWYRRSPAL